MSKLARIRAVRLAVCAAALLAAGCEAVSGACPAPVPMRFEVQSEIRRDVLGFTQGLEAHGGKLFESTGAIAGDTRLTTIDAGGHVTVLANFGRTFFGEGLTILDDQIFQLSWQEHAVFVYSLDGTPLRRMDNPRDGWGLTNDGTNLIFTDGGDRLYFADPETFAVLNEVPVRLGESPLSALNELENVSGKIYANIFTAWTVVRVDPATGCVEASADLSHLWDRMDPAERARTGSEANFVLNGIAYDAARDLFYVTGKNWRLIFTGRFLDGD